MGGEVYGAACDGCSGKTKPILDDEEKDDIAKSQVVEAAYYGLEAESRRKIFEILQENYSYIDAEDMVECNDFISDYLMLDYVKHQAGVSPWSVAGLCTFEICDYLRDDFIRNIERKFLKKQEELKKLGG
jgi:hypothetical protein